MKQKAFKVVVLFVSCGILAGFLSGCAWSIGEGKDRVTTSQATRGQELIDLKRAKDQGAITEAEYETQKAQVLAR
jgi:hypothetical protein